MNAKERYKNAHEAARDGRYEEALREHIWFHDHALAKQPSLYGVRLSYALADWVDFGKVYPPALAALQAVRDAKTVKLQNVDGDRACSTTSGQLTNLWQSKHRRIGYLCS